MSDFDVDVWRERAEFRALCRQSLFFLTKTVVCSEENPNLLSAERFKASSDWLQFIVSDGHYGLFEDPRNHAKSTRSTVAIPVWVAIQRPHPPCDDDAECPVCLANDGMGLDLPEEVERAEKFLAAHPQIKGPDTRIAIGSETAEKAHKWVSASKDLWQHNRMLQWAFPELIWPNFNAPAYGRWKSTEYFLPGRRNIRLPDGFLRGIGITSKDTGGRVDIFLIDDLLSEESAESPSEVGYRCRWVRSITQQVEDLRHSVVMLITNRWGLDDPNSMVHDEMGHWHIWSRACWVCGVHGLGNCGRRPSDAEDDPCEPTEEPIWPDRHGDLELIREQFGDDIYYTQWGNRPTKKAELATDRIMPFALEVRAIPTNTGPVREACVVIPEVRDRTSEELLAAHEIIPLIQLREHYISIDPAAADDASQGRKKGKTARWAVSWFAMDPPTGRVFWLECVAERWGTDEAIEKVYQTWLDSCRILGAPIKILCEKVAAQTLVGSALRFRAQADRLTAPEVEMVPPARGVNKDTRIRRRYGWRLGQRKLYLRSGLSLPRVETRHFPTGTKDTLDTEAQYEEKALEAQGPAYDTEASMERRRLSRRRQIENSGIAGAW